MQAVEKGTLDLMAKRARARAYNAADMRTLSELLSEYAMNVHRIRMWDNNGLVPGIYGEGTRKWAPNAPSTIRRKGFNKPLHSGRQRHASGIFRGYRFRSWYQTHAAGARALARWRFEAKATRGGFDYAKALHAGSDHYPARRHQGWTPGLRRKALALGADLTLLRIGWRGEA